MFRVPVFVFRLPLQRIIFAAIRCRSAGWLPRSAAQRHRFAAFNERFATWAFRHPAQARSPLRRSVSTIKTLSLVSALPRTRA
jgi:hypothetical protein